MEFETPTAWAGTGLAIRPETDADLAAIREIQIARRLPEFAALPLPAEAKRTLLNSQFDIQRAAYRAAHADRLFLAVVDGDETIGRIYLADTGAEVVVLDIVIAADRRGRGLGATLLRAAMDGAFARGRAVSLHVDKTNPARRLYGRLGFRETGEDAFSWAMEARPR